MILTTEAIVLRSRKYGDSSRLVSLFTYENGLLTVIAKGSRNFKSKFGSSVQPLSIINANIYKKPNRDLHLLSNAELEATLSNIHKSIEKITVGMALMESILLTQEQDHANPELYETLKEKLIKLNTIEIHPFTIFISFQIKLAEIMGFGIDFSGVNGSREDLTFFFPEGNFLNQKVYDLENSFILQSESINIIRNIFHKKADAFNSNIIDHTAIEQIVSFFSRYFSYHLEKKFHYNSLNLINDSIEL
jgi:DNA repair protein RecO